MITKSISAAVLALVVSAGTMLADCKAPDGATELRAEMAGWINQQRKAHGLDPLKLSGKLAASAKFQACDMAEHDYFGHSRPGGPKLGARVKAAGYAMRAASENIAYTRQLAVASAAELWRNSPPHWANILSPDMRDLGVAVVLDEGRVLWVMNVGRPRG